MDTVTLETRSRMMAAVRTRDTKPEREVRSLMHGLGLRFRLHDRRLAGTPDIVLRRHRTVVFVHGCFWHGHRCPRGRLPNTRRDFWEAKVNSNRKRDRLAAAKLRREGWRVLTVWECEVKRPDALKRRLIRLLGCSG